MEGHWHGLHELPGGEVDSSGREVNLLLIGELTAATLQGCRGCRDRLLDSACRDAVVVVRLVETACLLALRMRDGDLAPTCTRTTTPAPERPSSARSPLCCTRAATSTLPARR